MERTVISWTPENWITILLMVVVGYSAIALVARGVRKVSGKSDA